MHDNRGTQITKYYQLITYVLLLRKMLAAPLSLKKPAPETREIKTDNILDPVNRRCSPIPYLQAWHYSS